VKPQWALVLVLVAPMLLAAKDPRGDVTDCVTGQPASGPDLVTATGTATELGTVAVWRLTFDRPIPLPSDLRIDVLVRDPRLAPVTVGDEHGMNRIVRWVAASSEQPVEIEWLPHDGSTSFNAPIIHGRTIELVAPGRLLLGENVNGTESVRRARWGVVIRRGGACDRLGGGLPVERLEMGPTPAPSSLPTVPASPAPPAIQLQPSVLRVPWALLLIGFAGVAIWLFRRRSVAEHSSSRRP
jgi:hypothetical protein